VCSSDLEIQEGSETKVRRLEFVGNDAFDDGKLKRVVGTQEYSWWRFFNRNDNYDPDRLEYDKELLRRYYLRNGFADVRVVSAEALLSENGEGFTITYTVEEGQRYKVADVAVNIGEAQLDSGDLAAKVRTSVGDYYDATRVDRTVENLTLEAARQGFVFARVNPDIQRNEADGTLNITYNLVEGPRVYIDRIDIVGNIRTEDQVIRRQLLLYEGDAYNRVVVERARRRLTALDFFEKIDFREEEGSAPDRIVLIVEVQEKSTGSINFSIGYSTTEYVVGSIALQERNFLGKGYNVRANLSGSFTRQSVDFGFTVIRYSRPGVISSLLNSTDSRVLVTFVTLRGLSPTIFTTHVFSTAGSPSHHCKVFGSMSTTAGTSSTNGITHCGCFSSSVVTVTDFSCRPTKLDTLNSAFPVPLAPGA
jgi:outer membrane protein insertion porin family